MKQGWENPAIGDVCNVIGGGTPAKNRPEFYRGKIPWATIRDMRGDWLWETEFTISKVAIDSSSTHLIPAGNVLVATRVGLGKVSRIFQDTAINQDIRAVIPQNSNQLERQYLFYWFKSIAELIKSEGKGATVKGVTLPFIKSLRIPLPALKEQQRIVAILDEAFAGIATVKANAERNLQNARQVFESHAQSVFARRENAWRATTLGAEIELLVGFAFKSAQYTDSEDAIRLLRGDNIIQGCLRWEDVKKWPVSDVAIYDRHRLKEGDVVLAMDRPWVKAGLKRAVISTADVPSLLVQRTACLRKRESIDSRFLMHLISSDSFVQHILGVQTGSGVPHISGQQIKDFRFFLPSMAEQQRIADELESLGAERARLESIYTRKLTALDELKQSQLHQAFSGQL